jgi:hypothetical protein
VFCELFKCNVIMVFKASLKRFEQVGRPNALDLGVRRGDLIAIVHPRATQLASLLPVSACALGEGRSGGE